MATRPGLKKSCLVILVLMYAASLTPAQGQATFETPLLDFPAVIVVGRQYTVSCTCISAFLGTTLVMSRSDSEAVTAPVNCSLVPSTADLYMCVADYTFTAKLLDIGVTLTCTASQAGNSQAKFRTGSFNQIKVMPPTQYPVITGPDTVKEDENNTWTCVADGALPAATLRWRIGNTNVYSPGTTPPATNTTNVLFMTTTSISRVFQSNVRLVQIHCDLTHETLPQKRTKTINVEIQYKPIITTTSFTYTAEEGVNQRLACSIDAVPVPTDVHWLKDNEQLDRSAGKYLNGNSASNPVLEIVNPQKEDAGVFVCTATNTVGTSQGPNITVFVQYRPRVSIPLPTYEGLLRSSLTIPCEIDADPQANNITWKRTTNGVTVDLEIPSPTGKYSGGTTRTPALTINNLQETDAADYQCVVRNDIGSGQSGNAKVEISYAPTTIEVNPTSLVVNEGQPVNVRCSANGVPPPTYAWYFESNPQNISTSQTLAIQSVKVSDNGQYTCRATNSKGEASVIMVISVWFEPRITSSSNPQVADEGSTLTLDCTIDANPRSYTVEWQSGDGSAVDRSSGRISGGTDGTTPGLTFTNIQIADAGSYRCRVSNAVGTTFSPFVQVTISYPPRNIVLAPANSVHNLNEGDTLTLTCSAEAEPPANYTWKAGNAVIGTGSSLVIASAGPEDNRNVTCEATNSKDTASRTTTINVSYKPRSSNSNPVFGTTIGTKVTLICQVDANPAATSYTWSYGGVTLNETGASLDVTPQDASSFGQYTCTATNTVGTSDPIVLTLQRSTPPGTGGSTAAAGLPIEILILIILLIIILIIVIVVIVAICVKKGKCKKKDPKGRVGPVIAANAAGRDATPRPTEKPLTEAHSGVRSPQWSAVSRQHVNVTMNGQSKTEHDKLSIEEETRGGDLLPNGVVGNEAMAGGTIISIPDGLTPRAHHLPPVERPPEKKKKRNKRKKHREKTPDKPADGTIDEEEEEEE